MGGGCFWLPKIHSKKVKSDCKGFQAPVKGCTDCAELSKRSFGLRMHEMKRRPGADFSEEVEAVPTTRGLGGADREG